MAGLLSAAMLAELQSDSRSAFGVCSITLPGGALFRVAGQPASSATLGQFHGRVLRWGNGARKLSDRDGALRLSTYSVTFEDLSNTWSNAVEGSGANALRGSVVTVQVASPNVTPGSWFTWLTGTVDTWRMDSPHVWTVTFQANQQQLKVGKFPKTPILQIDFPNVADQSLYGQWVPLIYGVHDSRGSGDTGIVPCPYVDTVGFRYLVALGWVTCDRVYSAGVLKTVTSDYTVDHTTINGRLYTLINFISDQTTNEITADVTGYESVGNGSGSTLTGANALKHLLSNFVYGDSPGGTWLSDTTAVDTTNFSAIQTVLTNLGIQKVSERYGGDAQTLGMDALNSFCRSLRLEAFWTSAGKLALAFADPATATLWKDDPAWLRYDRDQVGEFSLAWDRNRLASRVAAHFLYSDADGKFMQVLEVRDNAATEDVLVDLALDWSHRSLL